MSHTISHTAVLEASADELWEVIQHIDTIFGDLTPEFISQNEFVQGYGEPGSIRWVTTGPAMQDSTHQLERIDKFDSATKTFGYTVLDGDPRYSTFSAEIQFEALSQTQSQATWTATFTPVGEMGPTEHLNEIAQVVFETMEEAAHTMKTFTHTENLDVTPDAMWSACEDIDKILLNNLPEHFESVIYDRDAPGIVRVVKFGPAIAFAEEVTVRLDLMDREDKKMGFTVLKGDPRFKLYTATMQFMDGPRGNTTTAVWKVIYITVGDEDVPPIHVKNMVVTVWETLAAAANADLECYA